MTMGYPVSYRSGARKYGGGGFQNPLTVPPGRGPGRPANDNWPKPANDNDPGAPRVTPPKNPPFPGAPAVEDFAIQLGENILPPQIRKAYEAGKAAYQVYEWFKNPVAYPEVDLGGDWRLVCGPVFSGYQGPYRWAAMDLNFCGLSGQAGVTQPEPVQPPPNVAKGWSLVKHDSVPLDNPTGRWAIVQVWTRRVQYNPASPYGLGPLPRYAARPWFPMAVPNPLPATVDNPLPAAVPAPVGNIVPATRPMPATMPRVNPRAVVYAVSRSEAPNRWPEPRPDQVNAPNVVVAPGTVTNPVRKPPGPRVKEKKGRMGSAAARGALGIAAGIYEDVKFYNDVLNAWYYAIPGKHDAKTPAQKALYIYRNADRIDINEVVLNLLGAVMGEKAGAYLDRARRKTGDNLGLNMYITIPTGSAPQI